MVHTVAFRVASAQALDFWAGRLAAEGIAVQRGPEHLRFDDPEGLGLELLVEDVPDAPLTAARADVPPEHALQGFAGVRAYAAAPERSAPLLERVLGFTAAGDERWEARGSVRGGWIAYETPPIDRGRPARARSTTSRGRRRWATSSAGRRPSRRPARGRRPSSSASTSARSTSASRAACCSSWRRWGPGFAVDEDPDHLASACRCRRSSRTSASASRRS
jgi:glyoxalase family protein